MKLISRRVGVHGDAGRFERFQFLYALPLPIGHPVGFPGKLFCQCRQCRIVGAGGGRAHFRTCGEAGDIGGGGNGPPRSAEPERKSPPIRRVNHDRAAAGGLPNSSNRHSNARHRALRLCTISPQSLKVRSRVARVVPTRDHSTTASNRSGHRDFCRNFRGTVAGGKTVVVGVGRPEPAPVNGAVDGGIERRSCRGIGSPGLSQSPRDRMPLGTHGPIHIIDSPVDAVVVAIRRDVARAARRPEFLIPKRQFQLDLGNRLPLAQRRRDLFRRIGKRTSRLRSSASNAIAPFPSFQIARAAMIGLFRVGNGERAIRVSTTGVSQNARKHGNARRLRIVDRLSAAPERPPIAVNPPTIIKKPLSRAYFIYLRYSIGVIARLL